MTVYIEVEIWSNVTIAGQTDNKRTNKQGKLGYSANGPWTAEMSKKTVLPPKFLANRDDEVFMDHPKLLQQ